MTLTPPLLSAAFRRIMAGCCCVADLLKIDSCNRSERVVGLCHSHDFCDPNQAMIDALASLGHDFDHSDDAQIAMISDAWSIARRIGFAAPIDGRDVLLHYYDEITALMLRDAGCDAGDSYAPPDFDGLADAFEAAISSVPTEHIPAWSARLIILRAGV